MNKKGGGRPHGQIRQSQLITTFGPGAMIDLPNRSVILAGLDHWSYGGEDIVERRLCKKLCKLLEIQTVHLKTPPPDQEDPTAPPTGVTAFQFPEWFITQDITPLSSTPNIRSRRLVHRKGLTRGKFIDDNRKRRSVVPIRFVRACRAGHIGDIDWYSFVHGNDSKCARPLWIDERGTSGDLTEVYIRCECKQEKSVAQASILQNRALGSCDGSRPWLGPYSKESCGEPNRLLIRTASNAYFPQVLTVISLPERDDKITKAVDSIWEFLSEVEDVEQLKYERKKARVNAALEDLSDDEVFQDILARRSPDLEVNKSVKQAELETLVSSKDEIGEDKPDGDFFARTLPKNLWNKPWMNNIERVVLIHRLREVAALLGFTRFEAL
ncbi:MAG: hypothetical protein K8F91_20810, partial [Candidatus Obscuribacterales bacterium]|nr:hypothetical protein [Candidatus Obscuribacterales bacterium]